MISDAQIAGATEAVGLSEAGRCPCQLERPDIDMSSRSLWHVAAGVEPAASGLKVVLYAVSSRFPVGFVSRRGGQR